MRMYDLRLRGCGCIVEKIRPRDRAAPRPGTTQRPTEPLAHHDRRARAPQTYDGAVPGGRCLPLKRRRLWYEEVLGW